MPLQNPVGERRETNRFGRRRRRRRTGRARPLPAWLLARHLGTSRLNYKFKLEPKQLWVKRCPAVRRARVIGATTPCHDSARRITTRDKAYADVSHDCQGMPRPKRHIYTCPFRADSHALVSGLPASVRYHLACLLSLHTHTHLTLKKAMTRTRNACRYDQRAEARQL